MNEDEPAGGPLSGDRLSRVRERGGLNDQSQQRIGLHLRALYDSVVQQPVPDRFRDLIAQLDETEPPLDGPTGANGL
ncbi:NepR family anti-sigma factor [Methylobacterium sp. Leaf118]|uniref:NepR family anti-sigma factor n=1 Tax=Methylobacterium sp. Leaf118 TaxID=2876562 RepID=UPI001E516D49|nr:NepR family anti-sigma factor [Methylobacterium sp. Leaf118]